MKVAFPRSAQAVEGIMVNTSGGLTGGDRFETSALAGTDSQLVLTTQAAERAYRSAGGTARVTTRLTVQENAVLHWLPQEFIVYDGSSVARRLVVDLEPSSECVLVEPIVFGRAAMREKVTVASLSETILVRRNHEAVFRDRIELTGNIAEQLARSAIAMSMTAVATVIYHGARAEGLLNKLRDVLPAAGGVSLLPSGLLVLRLLAQDSFLLRRSLIAVLELVTGNQLPKSWSL